MYDPVSEWKLSIRWLLYNGRPCGYTPEQDFSSAERNLTEEESSTCNRIALAESRHLFPKLEEEILAVGHLIRYLFQTHALDKFIRMDFGGVGVV